MPVQTFDQPALASIAGGHHYAGHAIPGAIPDIAADRPQGRPLDSFAWWNGSSRWAMGRWTGSQWLAAATAIVVGLLVLSWVVRSGTFLLLLISGLAIATFVQVLGLRRDQRRIEEETRQRLAELQATVYAGHAVATAQPTSTNQPTVVSQPLPSPCSDMPLPDPSPGVLRRDAPLPGAGPDLG